MAAKKLQLNRETLLKLSPDHIGMVRGGIGKDGASVPCRTDNCTDYLSACNGCNTNTQHSGIQNTSCNPCNQTP